MNLRAAQLAYDLADDGYRGATQDELDRRFVVVDADTTEPNADGSPYELGNVCAGPFTRTEADEEAARRNGAPAEAGVTFVVIEKHQLRCH